MRFRTEIHPTPSSVKILPGDTLLTMGSCFADHIGQRLHEAKWSVLANPFGTIYHPLALHRLLSAATLGQWQERGEAEWVSQGGVWRHHALHSELAALSRDELAAQLAARVHQTHEWLWGSRFLVVTYGTAWVYRLLADPTIQVANCHKRPAALFEKECSQVSDIVEDFEKLYFQLPENLHIILTISPVRHWKDGPEANSLSKAILRVACQQIVQHHARVHYFPAFELLMDDLRDYRFYASDLLHPSQEAVDYIWEKLTAAWFAPESLAWLSEWNSLRAALRHRPQFGQDPAWPEFLERLLARLHEVRQANVQAEIAEVGARLAQFSGLNSQKLL